MKLSFITDNAKFDTLSAYFTSKDRANDTENYFSWVLSSCSRYLETGDVVFLNNVTKAAKLVGQVRISRQLTDCASAHKFGKTSYTGKANKKQLTKLRENADKVHTKIEKLVTDHFEQKQAKATEVKTVEQLTDELTSVVERRVNKLTEAGMTPEQVSELLRNMADAVIESALAANIDF